MRTVVFDHLRADTLESRVVHPNPVDAASRWRHRQLSAGQCFLCNPNDTSPLEPCPTISSRFPQAPVDHAHCPQSAAGGRQVPCIRLGGRVDDGSSGPKVGFAPAVRHRSRSVTVASVPAAGISGKVCQHGSFFLPRPQCSRRLLQNCGPHGSCRVYHPVMRCVSRRPHCASHGRPEGRRGCRVAPETVVWRRTRQGTVRETYRSSWRGHQKRKGSGAPGSGSQWEGADGAR